MNQKKVLSFSVLTAAWLAFNVGSSWAQGTGATKSERIPESGTPMPKGAGQSDRAAGQAGQWGVEDVKHAQEALKSAGHDPGPIDGKIGPQTRQAIKAFQSSNGLKETGSLDAETAKKLGIDKSGSASGASSSSDRGGSSSGSPSSAGKQPSAPSQKESSSPMSK